MPAILENAMQQTPGVRYAARAHALAHRPPAAPQSPERPAAAAGSAGRHPAPAPARHRWPPGWRAAPVGGPCGWCRATPANRPATSAARLAAAGTCAASCGSCARWHPAPPTALQRDRRAARRPALPGLRARHSRWAGTAAPCTWAPAGPHARLGHPTLRRPTGGCAEGSGATSRRCSWRAAPPAGAAGSAPPWAARPASPSGKYRCFADARTGGRGGVYSRAPALWQGR